MSLNRDIDEKIKDIIEILDLIYSGKKNSVDYKSSYRKIYNAIGCDVTKGNYFYEKIKKYHVNMYLKYLNDCLKSKMEKQELFDRLEKIWKHNYFCTKYASLALIFFDKMHMCRLFGYDHKYGVFVEEIFDKILFKNTTIQSRLTKKYVEEFQKMKSTTILKKEK